VGTSVQKTDLEQKRIADDRRPQRFHAIGLFFEGNAEGVVDA